MSEEKKQTLGFKIRWADREIEYYGDSAQEVFNRVFEHVKSVPITYVQPVHPPEQMPNVSTTIVSEKPAATVEGGEEDRIIKDAQITREQLLANIKFEKREGFSELVPCLPRHPAEIDAVILVTYALQVGMQKSPIEVKDLRAILKGPNGYPLPGNQLGLILQNFRYSDVTIASQAQERYKPFTLSTKGLERARNLLKTGGK
jgi:hypothetical protein